MNAGAAAAGAPFPDTRATLPAANAGDTMADTRASNTCANALTPPGATTPCSELPTIDVIYSDVWTDPLKAGRPADKAFSYLYANLSTPSPANTHCATWDPLCRSTIHYPDATADGDPLSHHIQPIWNLSRPSTAAGDPNPDHTCVLCHNPVSAAGKCPGGSRRPAGFDGQRILCRRDRPQPLMKNSCLHITSRRLIWASCRICWCLRQVRRTP